MAHIPLFEALYPSPRLEYFDDLKKEAADARISAWTKKAINIIEEVRPAVWCAVVCCAARRPMSFLVQNRLYGWP